MMVQNSNMQSESIVQKLNQIKQITEEAVGNVNWKKDDPASILKPFEQVIALSFQLIGVLCDSSI